MVSDEPFIPSAAWKTGFATGLAKPAIQLLIQIAAPRETLLLSSNFGFREVQKALEEI
jgi:hypothetical protein